MKWDKLITGIAFFTLLAVLSLATIFLPKTSFSQMENRELAEFPKFSINNLLSTNYMNGIDTYVADHFVGRDAWVGLKGDIEKAGGKQENNGIFICDNRLIARLDEPNDRIVVNSIEAITNFAHTTGITPYLMLVPTAVEIQSHYLPAYATATTWSQQEFVESVYDRLEGIVTPINLFPSFLTRQDDYLYYRTDHHWTSEGAYLAYVAAEEALSYNALVMGVFDVETASNNFYGTLYSKAGYRRIQPDSVKIYSSTVEGRDPVTRCYAYDGQVVKEYESIYFREFLNEKDQYRLFLGQNEPVVTIEANAKSGNRLLIIKDSYANSFAPFMVSHFDEITLVDLRYINSSFQDYVDLDRYTHVLILYNVENFSGNTDLAKIDW